MWLYRDASQIVGRGCQEVGPEVHPFSLPETCWLWSPCPICVFFLDVTKYIVVCMIWRGGLNGIPTHKNETF